MSFSFKNKDISKSTQTFEQWCTCTYISIYLYAASAVVIEVCTLSVQNIRKTFLILSCTPFSLRTALILVRLAPTTIPCSKALQSFSCPFTLWMAHIQQSMSQLISIRDHSFHLVSLCHRKSSPPLSTLTSIQNLGGSWFSPSSIDLHSNYDDFRRTSSTPIRAIAAWPDMLSNQSKDQRMNLVLKG